MKRLLYIVMICLLISGCSPSIEDARQVKVGMADTTLTRIMGEPFSIHINSGYEDWYFTYHNGGRKDGMCVKMINGKVTNFYSY